MNSLELVTERVSEAKAIAWDTCHKIYVLMDNEQVELMREYGYDPLITKEEMKNYCQADVLTSATSGFPKKSFRGIILDSDCF